jgi:hypothetical protein
MIVSGRLPMPAIAAGAYTGKRINLAAEPFISTRPTVAGRRCPALTIERSASAVSSDLPRFHIASH